tara:strand:+ start:1122 stop:1460 length:339 start_codon:yes stop_codon:yes gene_type:complete
MSFLYAALVALGSSYLLWIFYLAVMNLKRARDAGLLTKTATALGYPVLFMGYALDCFVNVFVISILLLELPRETTVTARLKRHNNESKGWRKAVAVWAEPLLDPFDPSGNHI